MKVGFLATQILTVTCLAQTIIQGGTKTQGGLQVNSQYSRYVQIMALFPPPYNTSDYTNFRNNVMTQTDASGHPVVDGVTLEIVWSSVETNLQGSTPCPTAVNTDICQLDAVGQYHTYNWDPYDHLPDSGHPNSVIPWFDSFGGISRKVNFILSGINTFSNGQHVNSATPWYVTFSGYVANFPPTYNRQDVMNTVTCPSTTAPWQGVTGATYLRSGSSTTVTVTSMNCCSTGNLIQNGDPVWVYNGGTMNSAPGATVFNATSNTFQYTTPSNVGTTCSGCVYITAAQSSPVPYEQPYTVAWEAFLAAANLHFNPSYSPQGTNLGPQLGYVRSGTWVGGESYVYCDADLINLGAPYVYSVARWLSDYQSKVNYVQSLSPTMVRYWPIDPNTTPDTMAQYATSAANAHGFINGFGSQGLSARDSFLGCGQANADWCNLFTGGASQPKYYSYGMPLQLQQISISDETQHCTTAGACGTPPKSAGDLRDWLPFAVQNKATVFEMYYLDLALAFDGQYCTAPATRCTPPLAACTAGYSPNPAFMSAAQQTQWNCDVGLGNTSCPGGANCYATFIKNNHGPM